MAGIEALLPPSSSDPQARMWTQIRALQQRVDSLERRRGMNVSLATQWGVGTGQPSDGSAYYTDLSFTTTGSDLVLVFSHAVGIASGDTAGTISVTLDGRGLSNMPAWRQAGDASTDYRASRSYVVTQPSENVPPGQHTLRIRVPHAYAAVRAAEGSVLVLELPAGSESRINP